jgi:hypothetical protein
MTATKIKTDLTAITAKVSQIAQLTCSIGVDCAIERWSDAANGDDFSELAQRVLGELQAASALC